jgi:thioredoxin reductase (NADPH)
MSVLVVGSPSAGSLSGTDRIDNYPSFFGTTNDGGQGWIDASLEQAAYFGAEFAHPTYLATNLVKTTSEEHTAIEVHLRSESITTSSPESKVIGKAAIIATGSIPRKLNLAHESSLWGHALHNCALCDGDNYVTRGGAKKHVAVIGGGDAAVEAMFLLHNIGVDTIHWIHRRESYRATSSDVEKIRQLTNVEIWAPYVVVEWILKRWENIAKEGNFAPLALGGIRVVAAKNGQSDLEATSSITIPCDGAFLMIGSSPNTHWLESSGIDIDSTSKLIRQSSVSDGSRRDIINDMTSRPVFSTATSMEGVFAAGEVVDDIYRQALTASSEGAKAAIDVQRYLRMKGFDDTSSKRNNLAIEDRNKGSERASALVKRNKVDCDLTASECIKFVVSAYPVVVFSKAYCPFCRRALEVLRSYSDRGNFIEPLVLDLTEIEDPSAKATGKRTIQDTLEVMTGRRTVPNVFVGGVSIGGGDETTALHMAGKLDGILRTAGAFD